LIRSTVVAAAAASNHHRFLHGISPGRKQKPGEKNNACFCCHQALARACVCVWVSESTGEAARGLGRLRIESWAGQRQQRQRQSFGRWRWGSGAAPSCSLQDAEWNVVAVKLSHPLSSLRHLFFVFLLFPSSPSLSLMIHEHSHSQWTGQRTHTHTLQAVKQTRIVRFEKEDQGMAWHAYEQWRRDGDRKPRLEIDKHGIRPSGARSLLLAERASEKGWAGHLPLAAANSCSTSPCGACSPF